MAAPSVSFEKTAADTVALAHTGQHYDARVIRKCRRCLCLAGPETYWRAVCLRLGIQWIGLCTENHIQRLLAVFLSDCCRTPL